MFLKIVYLWLLVQYCSAEDIFERLYSKTSRRVTVCSERGHVCPAARWRRDWLLARASCLVSHPYCPLYVREGVDNCTYDIVTRKYEMRAVRDIVSHYIHPYYPDVDMMLLRMNWPWDPELVENCTLSDQLFDKLDSWVKAVNFSEAFRTPKPENIMRRTHLKMYSTPVRMFLVTVVLPSISFIVFFLFVIFFTGTGKSKGGNIPYKNLNNGRKETSCV